MTSEIKTTTKISANTVVDYYDYIFNLWSHHSNENVIVLISLKRNESARIDGLENPSPDVGSQAPPVYEEITDLPSVFKYTECPVYGMSTTSSTTVQVESHHEYEDVKLNNSDEQIQMTECPAYS